MTDDQLNSRWQQLLPNTAINPADAGNCLADLSPLGLIEVSGEDAASFLQGQLTCNIDTVTTDTARYGAYANIKGRVQSGFIIFLHADNYYLLLPEDNNEATVAVLKKYAMFSKVTITSNPGTLLVAGILGKPASVDGTTTVQLADSTNRALLLIESPAAIDALSGRTIAGYDAWLLHSIREGVVCIDHALAEEYTIQAINFDLIHAVDFDKGCYLGQEVIARAHFRGKTKQRAAHFISAGQVKAGDKLMDEDDAAVGEVLNAVELGNGSFECLANIKLASLGGNLTCEGYMLEQAELPYSLEAS